MTVYKNIYPFPFRVNTPPPFFFIFFHFFSRAPPSRLPARKKKAPVRAVHGEHGMNRRVPGVRPGPRTTGASGMQRTDTSAPGPGPGNHMEMTRTRSPVPGLQPKAADCLERLEQKSQKLIQELPEGPPPCTKT